MCRIKQIREKRCACSHGDHRNTVDRIRYATKQASTLTRPPEGTAVTPPPAIPAHVDISAEAHELAESIRDLTVRSRMNDAIGLEHEWAVVEERIRALGARLEQDAAEIAGFTAEDIAREHASDYAVVRKSIAAANRKIAKLERTVEQLSTRLNALRDTTDLQDFADAEDDIMYAMSDLQDALDARTAFLQTTADTYGITPPTEPAIIKAFEQGTYGKLFDRLDRLSAARLEILNRIRPMGGTITTDNPLPKTLRNVMSLAAQVYPSAWIERSNQMGNLRIERSKSGDRANYNPHTFRRERTHLVEETFQSPSDPPPAGKSWQIDPDGTDEDGNTRWIRPLLRIRRAPGWESGESVTGPVPKGWSERRVYNANGDIIRVFVKPKETTIEVGEEFSRLTIDNELRPGQWQHTKGLSTAVHEFAHRMEHAHPSIGYLEKAFHDRRTTLPSGEREPLVNLFGTAKEQGRIDSFANGYIGKEYPHVPGYVYTYEVMSTGMEALFFGQHGSLSGFNGMTADPDHRAFVLGALATA